MSKIISETFDVRNKIAVLAEQSISQYLRENPKTVAVTNVELDKEYQKKDIDLIWTFEVGDTNRKAQTFIEIKGDTYNNSPNYFIETVSNVEKNTPGCFIYSEADYIYYYFLHTGELTIFNMREFRPWFKENKHQFREATTQTEGKNKNGKFFYRTKGRLVPKEIIWKELNPRRYMLDKKFVHVA